MHAAPTTTPALPGDATAAKNLKQETLVEAWRSAKRPNNPDEQRRWLGGSP